jgi:predicted PurR-regulated permease PerM
MPPWLVILLGLVFVYLVRDVLPPFFIAGMLAYILVPAVEATAGRLRVRRAIVVIVLYAVLVLALGLGVAVLEPVLVRDTQDLVQNGPTIVESLLQQTVGTGELQVLGATVDAKTLAARLLTAARDGLGRPTEALHLAENVIRGVLDTFLVLIVLFYLLMDWPRLVEFAFRFVPADRRASVGRLASGIHAILGRYIRGQLYLVVLMATVTWVVLSMGFHLRYAFPVALATGFLEVIPLLGPVVAAVVAASVGLTQGGPQMALGIVAFYTVARQVEDQVVMPQIVGRAVHLHPIATVLAVLCGGAVAGVLGMILAVPAAATLAVILDEVWPNKR